MQKKSFADENEERLSGRTRSRQPGRSVLTIAVGKPIFLSLAVTLARSFVRWNKQTDIGFYIVTDRELRLDADLASIGLIRVRPDELGVGFECKLHLDKLAPTEQTLFIDADCLCFGNLTGVFERFRGRPVSVIGGTISSGEWFGDVGSVCRHFGLPSIPKFNGGVYYLEPGTRASGVYIRARQIVKEYEALGLKHLRGSPNDELVMSIAMALEGCCAIPDDGSITGDLCLCPVIDEIDVARGIARISNPPSGHPRHQAEYPSGPIQPIILHFLGDYCSHYAYKAARFVLALDRWVPLPTSCIQLLVDLTYRKPAVLLDQIRHRLRPWFHLTFGPRRVKQSVKI
jgi:hypothetical protein